MTRVTVSIAALLAGFGLAACDGDGVRITSTTTRTDDGGPLKVVDAEEPTNRIRFLAHKPIGLKVSVSNEMQQELNDVLGEGSLRLIADARKS